eukprot:scaffold334419_cov20-Prasinocladus_malaysianus.AAC.1
MMARKSRTPPQPADLQPSPPDQLMAHAKRVRKQKEPRQHTKPPARAAHPTRLKTTAGAAGQLASFVP